MEHYLWNDGWQFAPVFEEAWPALKGEVPGFAPVRLPHTVRQLPYNYCDEEDYQLVSCYRRVFSAPERWRGKAVLVTFGAVAQEATVYCNGQLLGVHRSGYTAFTYDLAPTLVYGGENVLTVRCDSRESLDQPPFGNVIDYLTYGGIYRDVTLDIREPLHFEAPQVIAPADGTLTVNGLPTAPGCTVRLELADEAGHTLLTVTGAGPSVTAKAAGVRPWSCDTPVLYRLTLTLRSGEGQALDQKALRIGFRTVDFRADGLYLNGSRVELRGLDRHQSWAYQGYAMPDRPQRLDADLLRYELGCNVVRTSHYPQSHAFIDRCDEIGLLVFTEIPGWQHIGGETWKDIAVENVREMVTEYRNHPSIFLWGVRINESQDDDELYRRTNAAAHALDPTRPTGGVRNFAGSHLLEDVYTYNEFFHNGTNAGVQPRAKVTKEAGKGYLITEYNGHMFPTKAFDWEEKRLEHALRYARVVSDAAAQPGIAGSIGWCMFDYNTHKDFGSGDRICYHGVTDLFRNPKLTAAVFASQRPLDRGAVLEVSSTMDIGEHPAGALGDIWAFTNADSIRLYKNNVFVKEFFPAKDRFPGLEHPPVLIDDTVGCLLEQGEQMPHAKAEQIKAGLRAIAKYGQSGLPVKELARLAGLMVFGGMKYSDGLRLYATYVQTWGEKTICWRFDAIAGGKVAASVLREPVVAKALRVEADTLTLRDSGTWDAATLRLRAVDQNGNVLPYEAGPVTVEVTGPLEVIGPGVLPLRGGLGGTYLRTTGQPGTARVTLTLPGAAPVTLDFTVEA